MRTKTKKISTKIKKGESESKPLTLEVLDKYTQKVLLPALDKHFATKKEFNEVKIDVKGLKMDVAMLKIDSAELKEGGLNLRMEFNDFKNSSLTNQDAILKKLDILLTEKEVVDYQKKKERELWLIVINSLKEHRILSSRELEKISKLEMF